MFDLQRIIPLSDAVGFQVQLREKERQGRKQKAARSDARQRTCEVIAAESGSPRKTAPQIHAC